MILRNKYFWISVASALAISSIILWLRQYKCENGQYPWQNLTLPAIARGKCSFWTAKPIINNAPPVDDNSATEQPGGATGEIFPIIVANSTGAPVYAIVSNVLTLTGEKVSYRTKLLAELLVTASGTWYKTSKGYLNANDVSIDRP